MGEPCEERGRDRSCGGSRGGRSRGHMTIFDRSWCGRVMMERVKGLAT